jgi:hypothetical protein
MPYRRGRRARGEPPLPSKGARGLLGLVASCVKTIESSSAWLPLHIDAKSSMMLHDAVPPDCLPSFTVERAGLNI